MWKHTPILIEHYYPFTTTTDSHHKPLVRKKLNKAEGELEKTKVLASLKHDCLIKLEGLQEQGGEYWMVYEYVAQSIQKWAHTVTREFIEHYQQKLMLFSRYLADKAIIVAFRRENMGVGESGDPKYYLDTNFVIDLTVDKLALKKKYKEEIRQLIQFYIDKKNAIVKANNKTVPTQKKENSKFTRILEAIEKGKANLCADKPKESSLAVVNPQNGLMQTKQGKGGKSMNIQNIFIQKEMNKINKIQVMVGNKPVEVLQEEFKREYASSSFYINGVPTVKLERQGEARRLFSPTDKLTRFEEVKYKEYKTMKTSGEVYVQDFISVLEADDAEKLTLPGSPRGTMHAYSPQSVLQSPPKATKTITAPPKQMAIQPEKRQTKRQQTRPQCFQRVSSPRNTKLGLQSRAFVSQKDIKSDKQVHPAKIPLTNDFKPSSTAIAPTLKTFQLQKKVSQAIANSMHAISKFKQAKINLSNI